MFESQEEAITDGAGRLHERGDASENRFLATVGLGLDTLISPSVIATPQHIIQSS